MPITPPKTRKPTRPSQRRYYAEYHYPDDDRRETTSPWADAVGEYEKDLHAGAYAHRANGDDE